MMDSKQLEIVALPAGITVLLWRRFFTLMVLASSLFGFATNSTAQPEDAATSDEVQQAADAIREAYDAAHLALKDFPRDRFATEPALDESDYDSEAIAKWVDQNTRWVPYRGILRGAEGVLLDRKGNSLDRSLLLARLLEDAGYDARLARGYLSEEAAEAMLSRSATIDIAASPSAPIFRDEMVRAAERAPGEAAALAELVGSLTDRDSPEVRKAVADHWWVEAYQDGGWTAVDPLLTGPLAALRPDPEERLSPETLPDSLFHKVTIRVVIERWEAGETVEEVPFEHSLRAADAPFHDFELLFEPFQVEPAPEGSSVVSEAEAIAETAQEWLPVLRHGGDFIYHEAFDRAGNLLRRKPGEVAIARKLEEANSALQGLGNSAEADPTHLTALWLEYRIELPGREPKSVRREIFDIIGPGRRQRAIVGQSLDAAAIRERGRLLMGTHRILVTSAEPPTIALEKSVLELWANQGPQIAALVRLAHGAKDDEVVARAYREPVMALDLLVMATARHQLSPYPSSIYLASPNILTTHFTVEMDDSFAVQRAFDVVVNDVGAIGNGTVSAARMRLEQGVLDTMMEAAMAEPDERSGNAADLFALRGGATGGWRMINAESPNTQLPDSVRARIADALADGRIVVAPGQLGDDMEPAWWEIDPATGTTLGIGPKGWGAVITSDQVTRAIWAWMVKKAGEKIVFRASCKVAVGVLKATGHISIGGGVAMRSGYALAMLALNC